jgi:hypothetical protein
VLNTLTVSNTVAISVSNVDVVFFDVAVVKSVLYVVSKDVVVLNTDVVERFVAVAKFVL